MSNLQSFIKLSQGNTAAMYCIGQLITSKQDVYKGTCLENRREILRYIDQHNILGDKLATLYSDVCEENLDLMHFIITNASVEDVINASSQRDFGGRDILRSLLNDYEMYHETA